MHVGILTACYLPVVNGVTRMVILYKSHLEAAGHEVSVFSLGNSAPGEDAAKVYRSPAVPLGNTGYYFGVRYSERAQRALAQVDIIHCHHLLMGLEFAHRYGRCPVVYTNHTRYDLYMGAHAKLPQPVADAVLRRLWPMMTASCDAVVAPSSSVRRTLLDFGVKRPIVVINNGIELARYRGADPSYIRDRLGIPAGTVLLVYVGRLSPEKNLVVLLREFAEAAKVRPELYLALVGSGPLENKLRRQLEHMGIMDRVHFAGSVPFAQVPGYLTAADIFATASLTEVHPLSVIEAMAAGLPVLALNAPGIRDLVEHGITGLLANNSEGGLAKSMVEIAQDQTKRRQMGAAARRASLKFDIAVTIGQTLALYRRLLNERANSRPGYYGRRGSGSRSRPNSV